jgi:hypothetical protein
MRPTLMIALLAALGCLPLAFCADPPEKADASAEVERLIQQLASRDFKVRDAAGKALEARGTAVLPALRQARDHQDPEVRRRLEELIPALEAIATFAPKRVTLDLVNKPVKDAVDEVSKQTGYKISFPDGQVNPRGDKLVYTFQMKEATFWEAIDKICEVSGLHLNPGYGDEPFRLFYQDTHTPYVDRNGPFRVVAEGFHFSRSIRFGQLYRNQAQAGVQASESMNFSFYILTEPKLPILGLGEVRLTDVRDELGNSMTLVRGGENQEFGGRRYYRYGGGHRQFQYHAQANLTWPVKAARKVRILKGIAPVTVLAEQRPAIVIDKIREAKGKKFKAGTIEIDIDDVKAAGGAGAANKSYDIKMSLRDTSRDNLSGDYSWMESLNQRLELRDAKGNKFISRGNNWENTSPSAVNGTWMFGDPGNAKLGDAEQLIFYNWVTMDHEVTFEFRDLPLP